MTSPLKVNCPNCQTEVEWSDDSSYRPFCSKRCKLIDFGDWASERHSIPGEAVFDEDLESLAAAVERDQ